MTSHVITVNRETPIIEAVRLILEHRFNCLPVVDAVGHLVGILTEVDVFRLFIQTVEDETTLPVDGWAKFRMQ